MENRLNESLLIDYLEGTIDDAGRLLVEKWYSSSDENKKLLEQLYFVLFVSERLNVMDQVDVDKSLSELKSRIKEKETLSKLNRGKHNKFNYKKAIAIAAMFIGILYLSSWVTGLVGRVSAPFRVTTGMDERAHVVLPDGSEVWLNANSEIAYQVSFLSSKRKVDMRGEAYFEVKKDKDAPFVVSNNQTQIQVLGTKFNVRANPDEHTIAATLFEGSVLITSPKMKDIELKPNQHLTLDDQTGKTTLSTFTNNNEYIAWIEGSLSFEEATLEEIARSLEQQYNIQIVFLNDEVKNERFTCDFESTENIYQVLSILSLTNKFDYKINNRRIEISNK